MNNEYEVGKTVTVTGKIAVKDEVRKDGKASKMLALPFNGAQIYSRVISGTKEWDMITNGNITAGMQVTIKGELLKLIGVDDSKYNYMGIDSIVVEDTTENNHQIIREDAKSKFVEAMMDGFEIGKLRMNFIEYDTTKNIGERQTANIAIYLDVNDADMFAENILNGYYASKIKAQKTQKASGQISYFSPVEEFFGGTSARTLSKRGQARKDGKAVARVLSVEASTSDRMMLVLTAQQGPGIEGKTGAIQPERNKFEQKVQIPMSRQAAQRFALAIRRAINAYETSVAVQNKLKEN